MATIVEASIFLQAIKIGLAKVKDANCSLSSTKTELTLVFAGSSVRYERILPCEGKSLGRVAFDAALLFRMAANFKDKLSLSADGSDLQIKHGTRSTLTIPSVSAAYDYSDDTTDSNDDSAIVEEGTFSGWLKQHPLTNAASLKKALSSIKDNITKTELVVDMEWGGKSDILKIKMVDQFHGILAYVKLKEEFKKKVAIRLPLSSFLLLLDIDGKMYIDGGKVIIKNAEQSLACRFIAGSSFGSIDDMIRLTKEANPQVTVKASDFLNIVKRVVTISEQDDAVTISAKNETLIVEAKTTKASITESLPAKGKFKPVVLSPKNLQDIALCLTGDVSLTDIGSSIIFKSAKDDIVINGALVKMEV